MPFFHDILGQDETVAELRAELARGRTSHAYLFEGRAGTGRLSLARAFAAAALCSACAEPDRARAMWEHGTHPDYMELPRQGDSLKIGLFVTRGSERGEGVDGTPVVEFLQRKPLIGDRLVCVIPDAERMVEAAANAFLKTLEEPPGDALMLLTTSARDRLLPTIVSRCRGIRLRPLSAETIANQLTARGLAAGADAGALAAASEGSMGAALAMGDTDVAGHWDWIASSLDTCTPAGAMTFAAGLLERAHAAGTDGSTRRMAARGLLDLVGTQVRLRLRQGLDPAAGARALTALWTAGEQILANVRLELVLHLVALETCAALKRG